MAAEVALGQRPRSKFSPDRDALACAGQGCAEREQCLKYRRHAAWIGQRWASFDIERVGRESCQALEPVHSEGSAMKRRNPSPNRKGH